MTLALIYGAGSGALHALTGPDHVLSLGPLALRRPHDSLRVGLHWGLGHAFGTLLLALPALLLAELIELERLAAHGTRIAGVALMATAVLSLLSLLRAHGTASALESRSPLVVGVVHGLTGAASLLLVLPMIASGSMARTLSFLFAFGLGSALAMAGLTFAIARVGQRLRAANVRRAQWALTGAGFAVGALFLGS
jgi:hypothetical protein